MRKIFTVLIAIFFIVNIAASNVQAEIKTYEGVGEFLITNEKLDYAKQKAKLDGARHIVEEIFLKIKSSSGAKNSSLVHDEIIAISEGLIKITNVKYKLESTENDGVIIKAFVTAEVDTVEFEKIIKKFEEE